MGKMIVSVSSNTMGAGKSLFCDKLLEEAKNRKLCARELHFAEPLKRTLAELIHCASDEDWETIYQKAA